MNNSPQIPRLETRQTAHIRANYPTIEYLEEGYVADWLKERKDQLLELGREERSGINANKLICGTVLTAGFFFHALSPLAPVGVILGLAGYAHGCFLDAIATGSFSPFPFVRGNVLDLAGTLGNAELREQLNGDVDEFEQLQHYISPAERKEYAFLNTHFSTLAEYLTQVEPLKRFHAYRWIFDCYIRYKSLPSAAQINDHMRNVEPDIARINHDQLEALNQHRAYLETKNVDRLGRTIEQMNEHPVMPSVEVKLITDEQLYGFNKAKPVEVIPITPVKSADNSKKSPDIEKLLALPMCDRATAVIAELNKSGFDLAKCIQDQITVIAGNQRGGKGTLMAILAILSKAIEPQTKIHYFTAGDDIYPFKCDRLVCRLNYPALNGDKADAKVAQDLYKYLQDMDNATQGEYKDIILVIDEAVALSGYLDDEQKQWIIRFLFTRANKKGAQTFIVLHGKNLTSWVGTKNTAGFADTFKSGATFVGCEATSLKLSPLKSISVATGRYFLADPDSFEKAVTNGGVGIIPDWLKTEINPASGQPDPARTLLNFFPELLDENSQLDTPIEYEGKISDAIANLENSFNLEPPAAINSTELIEQSQNSPVDKQLSEAAQLVLDFFDNAKLKTPKSIKELKDANKLRVLDSSELLMALRELVVQEWLTFDAEGRYLKISW